MDRRRRTGGNRPSRAIAMKTRAEPSIMTSSTDVMPATPAAATMGSTHVSPTCSNAVETPAFSSIWSVRHHAGQHGDDGDVKDGADE